MAIQGIPAPGGKRGLAAAMAACEQAPGISVHDHGIAVGAMFRALMAHLRDGSPGQPWWRVPGWARLPGLHATLLPEDILAEYHEFHDCGKPLVRTVDGSGRQHFPGHAAASEAAWLAAGGDPRAARLMGMDMDAHLLRPEGVAEFAARPEAASLLLTAVAEVHANAATFGGPDSDSFKIKAKRLETRGRQVCALLGLAQGAGGTPP